MSGSKPIPRRPSLTYVRVGQKVDVTVDTYPDDSWTGTVDQREPPRRRPAFSLLPAQNSSGKLGQGWCSAFRCALRVETPAGKPPLAARG